MTHSLKRKILGVIVVCLAMGLISCCLYACCSQESLNESAGKTQPESESASVIQWTPETECGICHITETDSAITAGCEAFLSEDSCMICHDEENTLLTVHAEVTTSDRAPTRLKKTMVGKQACLDCHAQELESLTGDILTDANGKSVNPHALPQTASHEEISCGDCHKMHSSPSERMADAEKLCQSCHHANVYECYTCHEHD